MRNVLSTANSGKKTRFKVEALQVKTPPSKHYESGIIKINCKLKHKPSGFELGAWKLQTFLIKLSAD